jgi:hypothetical protein
MTPKEQAILLLSETKQLCESLTTDKHKALNTKWAMINTICDLRINGYKITKITNGVNDSEYWQEVKKEIQNL